MKYISLLVIIACFSFKLLAQEKPAQALDVLITLYEKKDFDTLVRERYTEIHKAKSDTEIKKLIEKYKKRYADADKLKQVVDFYKSAKKVKAIIGKAEIPQKTETGRVARFTLKSGPTLTLYEMKSGTWGFHL